MNVTRAAALLSAAALLLTQAGCAKGKKEQEIRVYTSLLAAQGKTIAEDNEIQQIIADKIGAKCIETWMDSMEEQDEIFSDMLISGQYPDFIAPDAANFQKLVKAGALIPIDNYWDDYPNVKNYLSESEWNRTRYEDGHIYCIPQFSKCYLQDTSTIHNDEAFWVQVQVLEWAGYPQITTLDEYFQLLEDFTAANPVSPDGQPWIPYEIQADDRFFFALDNPPMFLDGYPNDGCCIVDTATLTANDYNLSPTAEKWFAKLNEEYHKGIIDPECFLQTADEYYDKIRTGRVLGFADQSWNFTRATGELPPECTYIPLGVVIEKGIEEHYRSLTAFNGASGMCISTTCDDPEGALQFLNDILSPEILTLRYWGVAGVDYEVGEGGVFYQTDEEGIRWRDQDYAHQHICLYSYFPSYVGMDHDGINSYCSSYQPEEFYKRLSDDVKRCFDAYGVKTYTEMLNDPPENAPWFPLWGYAGTLSPDSEAGLANGRIEGAKHQYLPQLVMSEDFEAAWAEYTAAYEALNPQPFFDALTEEVRRQAEIAGS